MIDERRHRGRSGPSSSERLGTAPEVVSTSQPGWRRIIPSGAAILPRAAPAQSLGACRPRATGRILNIDPQPRATVAGCQQLTYTVDSPHSRCERPTSPRLTQHDWTAPRLRHRSCSATGRSAARIGAGLRGRLSLMIGAALRQQVAGAPRWDSRLGCRPTRAGRRKSTTRCRCSTRADSRPTTWTRRSTSCSARAQAGLSR